MSNISEFDCLILTGLGFSRTGPDSVFLKQHVVHHKQHKISIKGKNYWNEGPNQNDLKWDPIFGPFLGPDFSWGELNEPFPWFLVTSLGEKD